MNVQQEFKLTPYQSPMEAITSIYQTLGIRRKNWRNLWDGNMTEGQRIDACRAAGLSRVLAYEAWDAMRNCDKDCIRAAFRRAWAERKH